MFRNSYYEDGILEIVVLGPMKSDNKHVSSSTKQIGTAIDELLQEDELKHFLKQTNTRPEKVKVPENWMDAEIVNGIMGHVDTADLVVVNITPFDGISGSPSPNVFYETGLLHALGMPVICINQKGFDPPFYVRTNRILEVASFDIDNIKDALRLSLTQFLNPDDYTDFTDNRITQFYGGLPVVDISAAVGLATGYYENFLSRLIKNEGVLYRNYDIAKRVIVIRPLYVKSNIEFDKKEMKRILNLHGYKVEEVTLTYPEEKPKDPDKSFRNINVDMVGDTVIDIPSAFYTLKSSPRMLSLTERLDRQVGFNAPANPKRELVLRQLSERLLDRVQNVLRYHIRKNAGNVHQELVYFSTIEQLPELLKKYGAQPNS